MNNKAKAILIFLAIAVFLIANSVYKVDEREKALVFQFGRIVEPNVGPGLHFKIPFINNVRKFDARVQTMDQEEESYLTIEKKNLIVDAFVKWKVSDPAKYFVTVGGLISNARARLAQRVNDSLRQNFGRRTVKDVISGDRVTIMNTVRDAVNDEAIEIGVEVVDVRLKRVDLDPQVSDSVYSRMEAERERVANDFRAKGAETAERIRADADRQAQIIQATAYKEAEQIRGEGDALATAIYANAFGKDREFYNLFRSLNAYKSTFSNKSDLMIIEPDSEFFKYFNQSEALQAQP
jgi:membrane protease subunit HflC